MDPDAYLPPSLRVPFGGDRVSLTVSVDIGSGASAASIAARLNDLQAALDLGERWGLHLAETAASRALVHELRRGGPEAVSVYLERWPELRRYAPLLERALLDPNYWYFSHRLDRLNFGSPGELMALVSSDQVPRRLGRPMVIDHLEYRNPLDLVLIGGGFVLVGSIKVLRMVRDWSSQRRIGAAIADAAEAAARQSRSRAELGAWLVEEAKAGRQPVPIGDLVRAVTADDLAALSRLADTDVQLTLPGQLADSDQA